MNTKKIDYIGGYKPNGMTVHGVRGNYRFNKNGKLDNRFGKRKSRITRVVRPQPVKRISIGNILRVVFIMGVVSLLATYKPVMRIEGGSGHTILEPIIETEVQVEEVYAGASWTGYVSYYSHAGCLGCNPNQIMSNGEPFDENAMTLAFNYLPMNTLVRVTNLENGISVIAKVTDTGGFNQTGRNMAGIPYENSLNRLADLSLGLKNAIGAVTDQSLILVEEI